MGDLDWKEGGEEYDAKLVTPLSALNWSHGWGWKWMDLSTFFWTIRPLISELCRRPAYLNKHDQERCDCRPRRQHLGLQLRIQRESFLPFFLSCQNLQSAKYSEESNRLRGTVLIFDELTSSPGLLLRPLLWEKCETE